MSVTARLRPADLGYNPALANKIKADRVAAYEVLPRTRLGKHNRAPLLANVSAAPDQRRVPALPNV